MSATQPRAIADAIFVGGGEMGALMRARFAGAEGNADWTQTPLGAVEQWSSSLKAAISILLNAPCPMFLVWRCDLEQNSSDVQILFCNDAAAVLFEKQGNPVPCGQAICKDWGKGWDNLQSDIEQVFTTGQAIQREQEPIANRQGNSGYAYTWSYSPLWTETGQIGGVVATGCKNFVEETLQRREEQLRLITDALPALIAYVDKDQYYRFNNQTYETWFGQPAETFTGKHVRDVLGKTAYEVVRPLIEQVLSGQWVSYESQIPYMEGGTRYIQADYVPHINRQGEVEGYFSLVSDISDRKQAEATLRRSEEQLQLAQQAGRIGTWEWNLLTQKVSWSEGIWALLGLEPGSIPLNFETFVQFLHPDERQQILRRVEDALAQGEDYSDEFRVIRPDGTIRWLLSKGQIIRDQDGKPERLWGINVDVTDRKQAEVSLRESEARFQTIVRNMPGMIYRYTPGVNGTDAFTYVSSGARDLLELEPETILQDSGAIWSLFHPDDLPLLRESVAIAVKNAQPWQGEGRLTTPSGRLKWIQGKSRPELTESGMVWDGLLIDITERKQAEQALRESEEWARLAIQVGRLGGWRLHLDTNLVEMDQRMREIWGEPEDAVMIPLPKVLERMHPDDRTRVATAVNAAIDSRSSGTYEIEYRLVWNDGTERWVLAKGQAQFEGEGESRRTVDFFGTLLDITDRKQAEAALRQSEERYRYLAESIPQLVWTTDGTGALIDVNQRWSNFTGLSAEKAATEGWQAVVHPEDVATLSQNWAIAQQTGNNYQAEGRIRRADGTYRWHLHQAVPLKNAQGQVIKWFGTATDIEDQKQLEQQRTHLLEQEQAAREQAEAANRIKDEFLAVLSHELRSPLNPILGWSKLLQTRQFDQQGTKRALQTSSAMRNFRLNCSKTCSMCLELCAAKWC